MAAPGVAEGTTVAVGPGVGVRVGAGGVAVGLLGVVPAVKSGAIRNSTMLSAIITPRTCANFWDVLRRRRVDRFAINLPLLDRPDGQDRTRTCDLLLVREAL